MQQGASLSLVRGIALRMTLLWSRAAPLGRPRHVDVEGGVASLDRQYQVLGELLLVD